MEFFLVLAVIFLSPVSSQSPDSSCYESDIICERYDPTPNNPCSDRIKNFYVSENHVEEPLFILEMESQMYKILSTSTEVRWAMCDPPQCEPSTLEVSYFYDIVAPPRDCEVFLASPSENRVSFTCGSADNSVFFCVRGATLLNFTRLANCSDGPPQIIGVAVPDFEMDSDIPADFSEACDCEQSDTSSLNCAHPFDYPECYDICVDPFVYTCNRNLCSTFDTVQSDCQLLCAGNEEECETVCADYGHSFTFSCYLRHCDFCCDNQMKFVACTNTCIYGTGSTNIHHQVNVCLDWSRCIGRLQDCSEVAVDNVLGSTDCTDLENYHFCHDLCSIYGNASCLPVCEDFLNLVEDLQSCSINCTDNFEVCETLCSADDSMILSPHCYSILCPEEELLGCEVESTDCEQNSTLCREWCVQPNTSVSLNCSAMACIELFEFVDCAEPERAELCNILCSPETRLVHTNIMTEFAEFCEFAEDDDQNVTECRVDSVNCEVDLALCRQLCGAYTSNSSVCPAAACVKLAEFDCDNEMLFGTDCLLPENALLCRTLCSPSTRPETDCVEELRTLCLEFNQNLLSGDEFVEEDVDIVVSVITDFTLLVDTEVEKLEELFEFFEEFIEDAIEYLNADNAEHILEELDRLYLDERIEEWEGLDEDQMLQTGAISVDHIETMAMLLGMRGSRNNETFLYEGNNIIVAVEMPDPLSERDYMFPNNSKRFNQSNQLSEGARVVIPNRILCQQKECSPVISSALVRNLPSYLERANNNTNRLAFSHLLSTQVMGVDNLTAALEANPVRLFFTPLLERNNFSTNSTLTNIGCNFWDATIRDWSTVNVTTATTPTNSIIVCNSTHLTSFAVLVDVTGTESGGSQAFALSVVTYIGCAISIVCLLLTIFCLIVFRKILNKGPLLYIHLNLAIALLLAMIVFVAGIETATSVDWLCTLIAALLHYFFLCVFCWMLAEGIMLYLLIVRVFGLAAERWYYLLILGWGLSVPLAAVSAGVFHEDYGSKDFCWIKADPGSPAIWLFVGPMILIILINTAILIITITSMLRGRIHGGAEQAIKTLQLVKSAIKGTVILLPLLGITWVFGLLAVNNNTSVFAWLFTISNSFQGLFIFLLHVLRNDQLLTKLKRFLKRSLHSITGHARGSMKFFTSKGTTISNGYTTGMRVEQTEISTEGLYSTDNL